MTNVLRILAALALACTLWATNAVQAQEAVDYAAWDRLTSRVQTALEDGDTAHDRLSALRTQLVDARTGFEAATQTNSAQISTVEEQIATLGPAPAEGEVEDAEIAQRRKELAAELSELKAPGLRAQEAQQQATGLIGQIDSTLRDRQTQWALTRGVSPLNPQFWPESTAAMQELLADFASEPAFALVQGGDVLGRVAFAIGLLGLAAVLLLRGVRFSKRLGALARRVTRSGTGVWSFVVSLGQILLPLVGVYAAIEGVTLVLMPSPAMDMLLSVVPVAAFFVLGYRWLVGRLFQAGATPLLPLDPANAGPLRRLFTALGIAAAISAFIAALEGLPGWSLDVVAAWRFPLLLLLGFLLWRIGRYLRPIEPDAADEGAGLLSRVVGWVAKGLTAVAIAAPALSAVGYNNAGDGLITHSMETLVLLALIVVVQRFVADLWVLITRSNDAREGLVPTLMGFVLVLLALPMLAMIWGARATDISELWQRFLSGFAVGDTKISPSVFMVFAIVFALGYMATRILQSAMRGTVLPKTRLDRGGQNAVVSGLGYIGIFLSALIAINTAGLDLSGLAIVAGALSVGIGFGLQNVVSNFVSGIILLIERPISEGDWVSVGGTEGYVRAISVRSTRIETFERADVIVPNADFVSGAVVNHTRSNTMGRLVLPVGVAYGTDTRKVQQLLLDLARDVPNVMSYPGPYVVFQAFGASTYDLELRVYIHDVNSGLSTRTELNHRIREVFEQNDIEIAFMQHDIWIRGDATKASDGNTA